MSTLRYTVTVQFDVDATDTDRIAEKLNDLVLIGEVVETRAKAVSEKKKASAK